MAIKLFDLNQTGSTVATSKVTSFEEAKRRMVVKLRQQIGFWKDNKGQNIPASVKDAPEGYKGPTKRGLWFKKMQLSDNYMFQLRMGQSVVFKDAAAEKTKKSWWSPIKEADMVDMMEDVIKGIEAGEADEMLNNTYSKFKKVRAT